MPYLASGYRRSEVMKECRSSQLESKCFNEVVIVFQYTLVSQGAGRIFYKIEATKQKSMPFIFFTFDRLLFLPSLRKNTEKIETSNLEIDSHFLSMSTHHKFKRNSYKQ